MRFCFSHLLAFLIFLSHSAFAIELKIIEKNSPDRDLVITEMLGLQRSLIVDPCIKHPPAHGFLLIKMNSDYVRHLLNWQHGRLIAAYASGELVGYLLLVDTTGFTHLYENLSIGVFESFLSEDFCLDTLGYIEQIAIKSRYTKKGLGTLLVNKAKQLYPDGLITDVFIHPIKNLASLSFFAKNGFNHAGYLHQEKTKNIVAHKTQVFMWAP